LRAGKCDDDGARRLIGTRSVRWGGKRLAGSEVALRVVGHALFAVLACAALTVAAVTSVGVFGLVGRPFPGLSLVDEGLVNPVGLSSWGGGSAGFQMWDRIIAVDGELVFARDDIVARALDRPVGAGVVYQVEGIDGSARFVELPTRVFTASDLVRSHTMHALLGVVFVVIAVLLYFLRPGSAEAWAFFGFFAVLGVVEASVVDMTVLWRLPPLFPALAPFLGVLGFVLVGVITRAYTKVEGARLLEGRPERGEPGFDDHVRARPQRRMVVATLVGVVVSVALSVVMLAEPGERARYTIVDNAFYAWLGFCSLLCFALLFLGYFRGRSPRRRARIRQILWAWPVGAGIPVVNLFCGHVLHLWPMSQLWNGFLLLVPLSTADAIVRHDLLRLNHTARRLVGGLTVAAAVGIALGFVLWSAVEFLKLDDAPAMVALAALLFAVAAPATHRVQSHVEGLLQSATYDAGRLVAAFTAKASTANHLEDVVNELKDTTQRSIGPTFLEVWRLDSAAATPRLVPMLSRTAPVDVDAALAGLLEHSEPQVVDDEQPAPTALNARDGSEPAIVVRLAVANEPVGVLVVGERKDGRPYEGADVSFVASLSGPLAAALVSTLAYEAVERLNRELEARVQARTAELAQKNDELALLNHRKDELVATVSHDFRSPLAIIRQNVQTVLRDLGRIDRDDLRMFLEAIARQEDRLTAMCTNLLDLARLKQKRPPQDVVDVVALVRGMFDGFALRARERGVALSLDVAPEAPTHVQGDGDRLGQVVQNLVDNALKFTPSGGTIVVRLLRVGAQELQIVVEDSGCGVPGDALPRLFEPFFQVPRQSHVGQGSGLGLAIVKAVVDAHGGRVDVASVEGRGTTFTLSLPSAGTASTLPTAATAADDPVPATSGGARLL
jgi:signal transduction histidine kinase